MPRLPIKSQTAYQLQGTIASYEKSIAAIEERYGFVGLHHPKLSLKLPQDVLHNYRHLHSMLKGAKLELEDRLTVLREYTKPKDVKNELKKLELEFADMLRMSYNQRDMQALFVRTRIFIQTYNV